MVIMEKTPGSESRHYSGHQPCYTKVSHCGRYIFIVIKPYVIKMEESY